MERRSGGGVGGIAHGDAVGQGGEGVGEEDEGVGRGGGDNDNDNDNDNKALTTHLRMTLSRRM